MCLLSEMVDSHRSEVLAIFQLASTSHGASQIATKGNIGLRILIVIVSHPNGVELPLHPQVLLARSHLV